MVVGHWSLVVGHWSLVIGRDDVRSRAPSGAHAAEAMTKPFEIVERGTGAPLVLIPGVQGRWEYSRALVNALARCYRVVTFSLCDERAGTSGQQPIDVFADQVE